MTNRFGASTQRLRSAARAGNAATGGRRTPVAPLRSTSAPPEVLRGLLASRTFQRARTDFSAVDVAGIVHRHAFSSAGVGRLVAGSGMNATTLPSLMLPMRMPFFHPKWLRRHGHRFGVRRVEVVLLVDEQTARTAELIPDVEQLCPAGRRSGYGCCYGRRQTGGPSSRTPARAADRIRRARVRTCRTS